MNFSHSLRWTTLYKLQGSPRVRRVAAFFLGGVCVASFFSARLVLNSQSVFNTYVSPNKTYTVLLKGEQGRAFVGANEVRVDVLKMGQPFASHIWLHSARDPFDLSFEAGFPNARWLQDNLLEFYRQQYFEKGSDSLVVSNLSSKRIKYLRVQSLNKFLLMDFEPISSVSMEIPAPRGDFQWIAVEGMFSDGEVIPFSHENFYRRSSQDDRSVYEIQITSDGPSIKSDHRKRG